MPPFPNFQNPITFPPFATCPVSPSSTTTRSNPNEPPYYLLSTIAENMTLSTNPTYVCKDKSGASFAISIKLPIADEGSAVPRFEVKGFRKGCTILVRGAKRYGVREGKLGFVNAVKEDVVVIPSSVETLLAMCEREGATEHERDGAVGTDRQSCQTCGNRSHVEKLSRCRGCESVWYCNKECQTRGWNDGGHKSECKILKAIKGVFPSEVYEKD